MLNGSIPIYILYAADTKHLRYAWAQEELRRIEATSPAWRNQDSISIRFCAPLDAAAVDEVWARIMRDGNLHRRIRDLVGAATDSTRLHVTPATAAVQGSDEATSLLVSSGIAIADAGFPERVLELYTLVTGEARTAPRILLACAYAECARGRYAHATCFLVDVRLATGALSTSDTQVLGLIEAYCAFGTGRISSEELLAREAAIVASGPEPLRVDHRLRTAQDALLRETDGSKRASISAEIVDLARRVEADPRASEERVLRFRLARLEAESDALTFKLLLDFHRSQASRKVQLPFLRDTAAQDATRWIKNIQSVLEGLTTAIEQASRLRHPILLAHALAAQASVQFRMILTMHMISGVAETRMDGSAGVPLARSRAEFPAGVIRGLIETMTHARGLFADAGVEDQDVLAATQLAECTPSSARRTKPTHLLRMQHVAPRFSGLPTL